MYKYSQAWRRGLYPCCSHNGVEMLFSNSNIRKINILNNFLIRKYSSSTRTYEEIKIPVPWGHISGKWWGPQDKRPILATHGWQDNSGSFDRLIPHLTPDVGVLAVDFPGHGLSSRLPSGVYYHEIDSAITLKRIIDYFEWPKASLMGHSLGAIINYTYTMLYPTKVDFLIAIEGLKPLVFTEKRIERMIKSIESFIKYDTLNSADTEPPSYSLDELKLSLYEGSRHSINLENCKYILKRNVRPSKVAPNKFVFGRDARLKVQNLLGWEQKDLVHEAHRVQVPHIILRASKGPFVEKKEHSTEIVERLQSVNKNFEYHVVEGTHHVHLNNPENLAGNVNAFIKKYDKEDRSVGGLNHDIIVEKQEVNV